jgi:hypothetical protein
MTWRAANSPRICSSAGIGRQYGGRWAPTSLAIVCLAVMLAGCGGGIDETYGQRSSLMGGRSVNGTAVLAEMFEARGHRVTGWDRLSPKLRERAEVIVWFPDTMDPPPQPVRDWFEEWLDEAPGRTLIYVTHDYHAGPDYWRKIKSGAPAAQVQEIDVRLSASENAFDIPLANRPATQDNGWFTLEAQPAARDVRALEGDPAWLAGVDPAKVEIRIHARLLPPDGRVETLLSSGPDVLVMRQGVGRSQLIVVHGGSFLLNMPLVNHEHRKLADQLIRQVGDDRKVVFLDCHGAPTVTEKEPEASIPTVFGLFATAPFDIILLHLTVVGLIFCLWRFPIFGVPRRLPQASNSDFGLHVTALGELLSRTGDRAYAEARLKQYHEGTHADTARSRQVPPPQPPTPQPQPPTPQPPPATPSNPDPATLPPQS